MNAIGLRRVPGCSSTSCFFDVILVSENLRLAALVTLSGFAGGDFLARKIEADCGAGVGGSEAGRLDRLPAGDNGCRHGSVVRLVNCPMWDGAL